MKAYLAEDTESFDLYYCIFSRRPSENWEILAKLDIKVLDGDKDLVRKMLRSGICFGEPIYDIE